MTDAPPDDKLDEWKGSKEEWEHIRKSHPELSCELEKYEREFGIKFTRCVYYSESYLRKDRAAEPGSKNLNAATDQNPSLLKHFATFAEVANRTKKKIEEQPGELSAESSFDTIKSLPAQLCNEYFNGLKAVYASLNQTPAVYLDDEKVAFVAPKREGAILAQTMGWQPFGRSYLPDVKRIPCNEGLLIGLSDLHLPRKYDRIELIDGAIASGATLMALIEILAQYAQNFDIYSVHATEEALAALSEFARRKGVNVSFNIGHVTQGLDEDFYAIDSDGKRIVGDLGDTIRVDDNWDRHDRLQNLLRQGRSEVLYHLERHPDADIEQMRFTLYARLCDTIYVGAKMYHGWKSDIPFYFWPGYDRMFPDKAGNTRMALSSPILDGNADLNELDHGLSPAYQIPPDDASILEGSLTRIFHHREEHLKGEFFDDLEEGEKRPAGIFRSENGGPLSFRLFGNSCSLWFTLLLKPGQDAGFSPGSTHRWLEKEMNVDGKPDNLTCLSVCCQHEQQEEILRKSGSFYAASFALSNLTGSAGMVADQIEKDHTLKTPWPSSSDGQPNSAASPEHLKARINLYSFWFAATFAPSQVSVWISENGNLSDEQLAFFLKKKPEDVTAFPPPEAGDELKPEFEGLASRIRTGMDWTREHRSHPPGLLELTNRWSTYNYWYCLPIDCSPAMKGSEGSSEARKKRQLGSVMLFSQERMDQTFLSQVRTWMQEVFLLFRQHESVRLSRETGKLEGRVIEKEAAFMAASHELKKLARAIPLADGKPHILKNLPSVFLMFSLPTAGKLNVNDARYLPDALHANCLITYRDWFNSLIRLAASIEAISQPMKSGVVLDESKYRIACEMFTHKFQICGDGLDQPSPPDFAVRCLFGTGVVCLLRNILQHSFSDYDNIAQGSPWSEIYEEKAIVTLTDRLLCITNPTACNTMIGIGGTNAAAIYYFSQILDIAGWGISLDSFTNAPAGGQFVCQVPLPFQKI